MFLLVAFMFDPVEFLMGTEVVALNSNGDDGVFGKPI